MGLEEKVNGPDPHHVMVAGTTATIGFLSYMLWPMYLISPYLAVISGGLLGYYVAKSVKE
ncbi:hypothetical protein J4204_06645 [Candidatus Woesearchaeota archaeon]|nr:hypothetical protein [Candidatus Woesearchaeota archaeon]